MQTLTLTRTYKQAHNSNVAQDCTIGDLCYKISQEDIVKKIIDNEKFKYPNYQLSNDYNNFLSYGKQTITLCTLELPFLDNQKNISCIPTGKYILTKHNSPKFKDNCLKVWELDESKYEEFEAEQIHEDNFVFPDSYTNNNEISKYNSLKDYFVANSLNKKFTDKYGQILKEVKGRNEILIHSGNTLVDTEGCVIVGLARNKDGTIVGSKSRPAVEVMRETLEDVCFLDIVDSSAYINKNINKDTNNDVKNKANEDINECSNKTIQTFRELMQGNN